jgi:hypothetical protein
MPSNRPSPSKNSKASAGAQGAEKYFPQGAGKESAKAGSFLQVFAF